MTGQEARTPAPGETDPPRLASDLIGALRARVAQRRSSGAYPPDLEHDLDVHFRHIVEHRPVRNLDALHKAMETFEAGLRFDAALIPTGSQMPGGELLHRGLAKLTTRQTDWMVQRMREFAESVRVMLWKMIETLDAPTHVHADLTAQIDAVLDRLAAYERAPADAPGLGAIVTRLEALEAAQWRPGGLGAAAGPADDDQHLAPRLDGCSPVVAVGATVGLLGRLAEEAVATEAVEPDAAAAHLSTLSSASLGGVVLARTQAMSLEMITGIVALAADRLRHGGVLVVDSGGSSAGGRLHAAHLTFLLREAGFAEVSVQWSEPQAGVTHYVLTATR
ncbi:MAG: hypothetical protein NVSMB32_08890 [Actinomycetota bacterium]